MTTNYKINLQKMGGPKTNAGALLRWKISQIETNCRQNQTESITGVYTLKVNDLHDQIKI